MKGELVKKLIFFALEILTNVISLLILPKSEEFTAKYLYELDGYDFLLSYSGYYVELEEELSSPRKTCTAILAFGIIISFLFFIKIILYLCTKCGSVNIDSIFYIEFMTVPAIFINWCMAISIIPKLDKAGTHKVASELLKGIRGHIIGIIVLYSLSYIFIILQYCLLHIWGECDCFESKPQPSPINYVVAYQINNNNPSRNNENRNSLTLRSETVQVRTINVINENLSLSSILPPQIYEKIKFFSEQGEAKVKALIEFFIDMKFDGLISDESITKEIADIICSVGRILSNIFGDRVARACLAAGTWEHLMILMHYAFPLVITMIKLKIEKGIYKRTYVNTQMNLIQVLTQVERRIIQDEQGNIRVSFRLTRQVNQSILTGLLNQ